MTTPDLLLQQANLLHAIAAPSSSIAINSIAACANSTGVSSIFTNEILQKRGLQAYRANAHALATRALQTPYPVIEQLLGFEAFDMLARDLWQAHPPVSGDLAQWGGDLADWMGQDSAVAALLSEYPYLGDVARTEWALHECATAADSALDAASFSLLTTHEPSEVRLRLAPGCQVVHSAWPVASIVLAHGADSTETASDHSPRSINERVSALLQQNRPESALVWRQAYAPRLRVLAGDEIDFVNAVLAGKSLQAALDAVGSAPAGAAFDFSAWLTANVHHGLVLGATAIGAVSSGV